MIKKEALEIVNSLETLVKEVGAFQVSNFRKTDLEIDEKSTQVDLVTQIDKKSEEKILSYLRENYPEYAILSEESGEDNKVSDYKWIVDPLDGTTNYAQGIPIFTISIGLMFKGQAILGVIYNPLMKEFFYAIKGEGAYLNHEKISVSKKSQLNRCVLATGFPYDKAIESENNAAYTAEMIPQIRGIRRLGSAAYDLANVALGVIDGYWEINLSIWDVAAGRLLVREAGGVIKAFDEKRGISFVAGNDQVVQKIYKIITKE